MLRSLVGVCVSRGPRVCSDTGQRARLDCLDEVVDRGTSLGPNRFGKPVGPFLESDSGGRGSVFGIVAWTDDPKRGGGVPGKAKRDPRFWQWPRFFGCGIPLLDSCLRGPGRWSRGTDVPRPLDQISDEIDDLRCALERHDIPIERCAGPLSPRHQGCSSRKQKASRRQ
jgi:hypothetical protein